MPDNYVEVTVSAKDDTGPGFASADAREKAFSRLMDQTTRKEIAASSTLSRSYAVQEKAANSLRDAIAAVQEGERLLAEHTQDAANKQGFLRTALGGVARALDGGTGQGGLLGSLFGASGALESLGTSLGTVGAIIVPLIALVGTLGIALFPLIANLGLVAVGFTAFAAVAIPEISKVWHAVQQGGKAWQSLSPMQKQAGRELKDLQDEFRKLERAVQPQVLKAFDEGLKILKDVMPAIRPLAVAAGKAIDGFLKNIDHWLNSASGKKFIHWMEVDGPHAIQVFGRYLWDVTKAVGRTFDFLYNTGVTFDHRWGIFWHTAAHVVDSFRIGFAQMGRLIAADATAVFHSVSTTVANFVRGFQQMGREIAFVVSGVVRGFEQMGSLVAGVWNGLVSTISGAVSRIEGIISGLNSALGGIPGKILGALGFAGGGIVGAATGGLRSGLVKVGEMGPELVQLPAGSRVYNANQTQQMLGGGSGQVVRVQLEWAPGGGSDPLLTWIRQMVRIKGGGNVQTAFGRP